MKRLVVVSDGEATEADLIGLGEAAEIVAVSKPRLHELYSRSRPKAHPFPPPIVPIAQGPLWHKPDVETWRKARDQRRLKAEGERTRRLRELEERLALEPPVDISAAVGDNDDWMATLRRLAGE